MKVATVCTGIGSPEQALRDLNVPHEIVFGCEIDKYARQTYLANFAPHKMFEDMTKQSWARTDVFQKEDKLYSDLFIGGIPCQAFSLAGKRLGELDSRGLLFFDFYRYVKNQQPKVFIIENVKGLLSDNKGKTFQNWLQLLGRSINTQEMMFQHPDSLGYNLHHTVLNTKDFGLPQNRERVFLVGIRKDLHNVFRFPAGWVLEKRLKDILENEVDEKYYLSEKMLSGFIKSGNKAYINQDTQASQVHDINSLMPTIGAGTHGYANGYVTIKEATKQGFAVAEPGDSINLSNTNSETRRGRVGKGIANTLDTACNQAVIEPRIKFVGGVGDTLRNKESKGIHSRDWRHQDRVYDAEGISETISTLSTTSYYKNETRIRRLTPLECFRLQGFPDSFVKPVSDTQLYKQAGNSITVNLMKAIINNLLKIIN